MSASVIVTSGHEREQGRKGGLEAICKQRSSLNRLKTCREEAAQLSQRKGHGF